MYLNSFRLFCILLIFALSGFNHCLGVDIRGIVKDSKTGEPLAGANIQIQGTKWGAFAGLDGTFQFKSIPSEDFQIRVTYHSYKPLTQSFSVKNENIFLQLNLVEDNDVILNEVVVSAAANKSTDQYARQVERNANQLMNIISGKSIEISPDLTVANLIQRVSGISIERNSNGDGQYAILRGMDKRYNYTLVNGIKIPSPDNKYRYVPLDIFPSELLGRLEVYKTLTPDLEGDAVGGVVNMVMKDAPNQQELRVNFSSGYNELFIHSKFGGFAPNNSQSPYELKGKDYSATNKDFSLNTRNITNETPMPNMVAGLSWGSRYLQNKLGVMLAGSYQNLYRGSLSSFYSSTVYDIEKTSRITSLSERNFADHQSRLGLHTKIDYKFNKQHKLQFYQAYMNLTNAQLRSSKSTEFSSGGYDPIKGNAGLSFSTRSRFTQQQIFNSTLQGIHDLARNLKLNWSAVYSFAANNIPDNTSVSILGKRENFSETKTYASQMARRWEHNSDQDFANYISLSYETRLNETDIQLSTGGLYRYKWRDNFYNNYQFQPESAFTLFGKDFNQISEIKYTLNNPRGSVASALTYQATEQIVAEYVMAKIQGRRLQTIIGLRSEHTEQGYEMLFPLGEQRPTGNQIYTDLLPSVHLKYALASKQNIRTSYFHSINRPGFFEIVPGKVVNEEFQERGNPDLKRAEAENFDLRYEFFPNASDQILFGVFYKYIKNPIEYALTVDAIRGQDVFYSPGNFGNASNWGIEMDANKYVQKFGIKANYTFTNSTITSQKIIRERDERGNLFNKNIDQSRPLFGQSAHVGNITLLYKDAEKGFDVQLAASYTGERINTVSQFLNNDLWQEAFTQMDASIEKKIKTNWSLFVKANNLLDTPLRLFIKNTNPINNDIIQNNQQNASTLIREDYYQRSFVLGVRYNLN